ncbi:LysR family transcriptional regulator [Oceaniglobus trochenteri]|uniref:LysR family transcriptional regulator n=1 Tax=Oceaniglobus trochenteri TaxID=2763260 RepID=UPI001CFF8161|nr:LysR family transcriptional regulator [Oceaniglobus trochenteri]
MDRRITTFLTVARTGSITEAAQMLNITQPTLSKRLQLLEESMNVRLLERLPRGVELTAEGRAFLPYARRMQDCHFQGLEAVRAVRSEHLDNLRIGAGPLFHLRFLGEVFDELRGLYPATTLRLFVDFNSRIIPRLLDGRLDVSFGTRSARAGLDELIFQPLATIERGIAIRKDHPLTRLTTIGPDDIAGLSWVVFSDTDELEQLITGYLGAQGHRLGRILLQTTDLAMAFDLVAKSDAAMILPVELTPYLERYGLTARPVRPSIGILSAGAYARPSILDYPVAREVIDRMRDHVTRELKPFRQDLPKAF